ncbi:unnamed protein product [Paramecium octaurelia]|uniref:Uncharacterized protein n=1 Tax=Paramecium octaurelia TaxID=43137 RepID=A0A8S1YMY6_PAROT|nr:unnamed protein product [Paramecium octaurelia]
MTCDPPPNSVSSLLTPWCSNCEAAVMKITLSDDLTAIIAQFDFPLSPNFFSTSTQFDNNVCFNILNQTTLSKLGINPMCIIDPDNEKQLILNLGRNPTIIPGDLIEFLPSSFGHKNCNSKLFYFFLNKLQKPSNPLAPLIQILPAYLFNPCDENIILMEQKLYDGLRSFISLSWSYIVQGQNGNGDIANFVTELTNLQLLDLTIPEKTLPIQSNVTLFVEVQNFVQKKNVFQIFIQIHAGQFPSVFSKFKLQYYPFESINLAFTLVSKSCIENSKISNDNSQYQINFMKQREIIQNLDLLTLILLNQLIPTQWNLIFKATLQVLGQLIYFSQLFQILQFNIILNKMQLFRLSQPEFSANLMEQRNCKNIQMIQIFLSYAKILISIIVNIRQLFRSNITRRMQGFQIEKIKINTTSSNQFFPKATFQPFTIQEWIVIATKNSQSYTYKIIIVDLEYDFKILDIDYNSGYLVRPVNNYEDLQFTFNIPFQNRQYLLDYQIAIIYDYQLISILRPQYYKYSFQLYDHYQQFNKGNKFNLYINVAEILRRFIVQGAPTLFQEYYLITEQTQTISCRFTQEKFATRSSMHKIDFESPLQAIFTARKHYHLNKYIGQHQKTIMQSKKLTMNITPFKFILFVKHKLIQNLKHLATDFKSEILQEVFNQLGQKQDAFVYIDCIVQKKFMIKKENSFPKHHKFTDYNYTNLTSFVLNLWINKVCFEEITTFNVGKTQS